MNLVVNGKKKDIANDLTVSQLLVKEDVKMPEMVSVELNGKVLKRSEFEGTILKDDDQIEFLYYMGGGSVIN
jgi:sulfur carrier protein